MRLVEIDKNILVNAESIDALEVVILHNKPVLNVWIKGKKFIATVELKKLLEQLDFSYDPTKQYWTG